MLIEAVQAATAAVDVPKTLGAAQDVIVALQAAEAQSEYQVEKLKEAAKPVTKPRTKKLPVKNV